MDLKELQAKAKVREAILCKKMRERGISVDSPGPHVHAFAAIVDDIHDIYHDKPFNKDKMQKFVIQAFVGLLNVANQYDVNLEDALEIIDTEPGKFLDHPLVKVMTAMINKMERRDKHERN